MTRVLVMVQREVGERLAAIPGSSSYGAVSVKVAYHGEARVVGTVPSTVFVPKPHRLTARKLWIAFAVAPAGQITVDDGARTALLERGVSLLGAGVVAVDGKFEAGDAVEIRDANGEVFAKGLARHDASMSASMIGKRTAQLPDGLAPEVVHRDDLVMLPTG